jgi:hypothetical protein
MLDYNVPGGKLNRGMAVYDVLVSIKGAEVSSRSSAVVGCEGFASERPPYAIAPQPIK